MFAMKKNQITLNSALKKRFICLLAIVMIYRLGQKIPLPLLDVQQLNQNNANNDIFSTFVMLTGGNMDNYSLFSVGLAPWMTAMILWQIYSQNKKNQLKKYPKDKIDLIKYIICLLISTFQSVGVYIMIEKNKLLIDTGYPSISTLLILVIVLTSGTFLLVWLANINTEYGFGGISSLIAVNVIARFANNIFHMLVQVSTSQDLYFQVSIILIALLLTLLFPVWIFIHLIERRYPLKRPMINNKYAQRAYIPIKLNTAGAMPIMFSISFFMIPQYLLTILNYIFPKNQGLQYVMEQMRLTKPIGIAVYLLLLFILSMGFSFLNYNLSDLVESLQKNGDYLLDIKPGRMTYQFLSKRLFKYSLIGSVLLILISGLPLLISLENPDLLNFTMLPGSLLILVSILLNLIQEYELYQMSNLYQPLFTFSKL